MASIKNAITMQDSMGAVLRGLISTMDSTISTMGRLDAASNNLDLGSHLDSATRSAADLKGSLPPIEKNIIRATKEQEKFNKEINQGSKSALNLRSMLGGLIGVMGVKKLAGLSDEFMLSNSRAKLLTGEDQAAKELVKSIRASAKDARGLYTDMVGSVTKLGMLAPKAFNNTDEVVKFTNIFQKMGTVSGSSASEVSNAMYQLNQAMASGRLQGDEFRSITENAPMLAKAIEGYFLNQGVTKSLKELASEGAITSDVIKAAMFSVADEVDDKFKEMPMTWGQVWNGVVNTALQVSEPLLRFINLLANNWDILGPIVLGVATAMLVYLGVTKGVEVATKAMTAATAIYNAVLAMNPIILVVLGIIAFIAVLYAGIAALNKFTGSTHSATGILIGVVFVLGSVIGNVFLGLINFLIGLFVEIYNYIAMFANFFANVFNDPVAAIAKLFFDLFQVILGVVQTTAKLIDTILNTNMSGAVSNFRSSLDDKFNSMFGDRVVDIVPKMDANDYYLKGINYDDAYAKGHDFGKGLTDKFSGEFDLKSLGGGVEQDGLVDNLKGETFDVNVKNDVNLADESLKYLLDSVTQKYINQINLEAPAPNVVVNFTGNIEKDVDLDELAQKTKAKLGEEMIDYIYSSTDIVTA